jgi:hypothetical protein
VSIGPSSRHCPLLRFGRGMAQGDGGCVICSWPIGPTYSSSWGHPRCCGLSFLDKTRWVIPKGAARADPLSERKHAHEGSVAWGDVMAENLMKWLPCLDKKDCAEIVYALEHFGLEKYRKNPLPYGDITSLALVNREDTRRNADPAGLRIVLARIVPSAATRGRGGVVAFGN